MCIRKYQIRGTEECSLAYKNATLPGYCPPVWDNFSCWNATAPGETAYLSCPRLKGNDVSKSAFRKCMDNGTWAQNEGAAFSPVGWTNYSVCINPYMKEFLTQVEGSQANSSIDVLMKKLSIAESCRTLEMFGLTLSIVSLVMSLIIFYHFRNLQNNRTRIHKNLFIAMSIQVIVRLMIYIDQYLGKMFNSEIYTIETTEYTCESAYILLEYARTSMFLWMFVEGLYLHNMITVAVFQERLSLTIYYIIGWGSPIVLVMIWSGLTHKAFYGFVCWWGYNLSGLFWVLEGPRLLVIGLNLLFLLNIIRVLVTKLRESNSSEAQQVRKATKAAIILLPLLGITNTIQIIHSPVDKDVLQFAIWSYLTTFLHSFQGFFCALIYCFLNGEVQVAVKRFFKARKHRIDINRRKSVVPGASSYNCQNDVGREGRVHTATIRKVSSIEWSDNEKESPQVKRPVDPLFEHWSDGELSSHNHVDIEQIEIPLEYFSKHVKASKGVSGGGITCGSGSGSSSCNNTLGLTNDKMQVNSTLKSSTRPEIHQAQQSTSFSSENHNHQERFNGIHNIVLSTPSH